jgi:hypothetical protein
MNKRMSDGVEVEMSSGNAFADVGLPSGPTDGTVENYPIGNYIGNIEIMR